MDNVLILCAHTDDEINMAGTITRHIEAGDNIRLLAFSTGNGKTGALKSEFYDAMAILDIGDYLLLNFEARRFVEHRQDILQILCDEKKPDIVYCPCTWDCHQDHVVITNETIRAFRQSSIYGYEILHNTVSMSHFTRYVRLERSCLELKKELAKCYESQKNKSYMKSEYFESLMRVRGHQISVLYSEAFETIRTII